MRIEAISFVFSFFPPFFKKKEKKSYPRLICESFETTNPRRETHEHEIEKVTLSDGNLRNSSNTILYTYIYYTRGGKFQSFESESRVSRAGNNVSPFCEPCTRTIYTPMNDTITRAESSQIHDRRSVRSNVGSPRSGRD